MRAVFGILGTIALFQEKPNQDFEIVQRGLKIIIWKSPHVRVFLEKAGFLGWVMVNEKQYTWD